AELRIEPGLTGIVGPNGCGKSNLLEAIRWVMGETSAKSMRSGGMEDVIFAGTSTRPPRDFAEVVLHAADDALEELVVTRRIERGAGSAYRVNGNDVRAKDVALTFADAATGAHSPALVSQGKIAQVIAAKPAERRQMLEEAAGISGLHVRRKDAESKLRQTEANLTRLEDLMAGLDAQIASLRRQAKQAERYKALTTQIQTAEARLVLARWRDAAAAAKQAREAAEAASAKVAQAQKAMDETQAEQARLAGDLARARDELADRRDDASAHGHRMATLAEKLDAANARLADLDRQRERLEADRKDADRLTNDAADALTRLGEEYSASKTQVAASEQARPALLARSEDCERASRAAEIALAKATADQAGVEAEWRVAEAAIDQAQALLERLKREASRIDAQGAELAAEQDPEQAVIDARLAADEAATELDRLRKELSSAQERKSELQTARDEAGAELATAKAELAGVEREHAALARDRDAQAKRAATRAGLPAALDQVQVAPGYERALAAVLGRDGKSPIGSPPGDSDGRFWTGGSAPSPVEDSLLSHVTSCPEELRARLALVHCVEEDDDRLLAAGEWLVTRAGHLRRWDGFIARGEGSAEAAKLEAVNRVKELEAALPALRTAADEAAAADAATREELSALQQRLIGLERSVTHAHEAERQALLALDRAQTARERIAARLAELEQATHELAQRQAAAETELTAAQDKRTKLPAPDTGRAMLEAAQAKHEAARTAVQSALAELAAHDQTLAVARERVAAQKAEQANWHKRSGEAAQRVAQAGQRLQEIEQERSVVAAKPAALMAEIEAGDAIRERLSEELAAAEQSMQACQDARTDAERNFASANERLLETRESRASLAAKAESEEMRRTEMARISGERF
ncbi:MAG: AAA family ATPase, partial [Pseudomonadota bacterium]